MFNFPFNWELPEFLNKGFNDPTGGPFIYRHGKYSLPEPEPLALIVKIDHISTEYFASPTGLIERKTIHYTGHIFKKKIR